MTPPSSQTCTEEDTNALTRASYSEIFGLESNRTAIGVLQGCKCVIFMLLAFQSRPVLIFYDVCLPCRLLRPRYSTQSPPLPRRPKACQTCHGQGDHMWQDSATVQNCAIGSWLSWHTSFGTEYYQRRPDVFQFIYPPREAGSRNRVQARLTSDTSTLKVVREGRMILLLQRRSPCTLRVCDLAKPA